MYLIAFYAIGTELLGDVHYHRKYLIIIGSNTDRRRNMAEATRRLRHVFGHCICSRTMTTPAIGMPGNPPFANCCMAVVSSLSPVEVTSICKSIEADLGRKQDDKANGIVRIDIDLAAAGDQGGFSRKPAFLFPVDEFLYSVRPPP